MRYRYTDKEIKTLLDNLVVIMDTREQQNKHIIDFFDKKKKKYKRETLKQGDYSCFIESNEKTKTLGVIKDWYFDLDIVIERKNSVDELVQSFVDRDRFEDELKRIKIKNTRLIWLIEDKDGYTKLCSGNYRSKYKANSAKGTFFAFSSRYDIATEWKSTLESGHYIYNTMYYFVKEYLEG